MKVAIAQINPVIGDFVENCNKIKTFADLAVDRGCSLVIFPELAVSGYPPQDLLDRESFLIDQEKAIESLLKDLPALDVMFGCFERCKKEVGKGLYNSGVVARAGEIVYRARKQLLPSYDVFDETRYFEPGETSEIYEIDQLRFGVTICEDVWSEEVKEYDLDPVGELMEAERKQSVDAIINISASPFQRGKEQIRKSIFSSIVHKYNVPFIYANQVGGQDSLLFDGRSMVIDSSGKVTALCRGFQEDLVVVDSTTWSGDVHDAIELTEQDSVYQGLVMGVQDYVKKCGFKTVVLGLSGGIDSALTAAIAVDALGKDNVFGVALPSQYSSDASYNDARELADNLGCHFNVLSIEDLFDGFLAKLTPMFTNEESGGVDLTEQNLQARIRGNLLMALSNKFGHLLLTTGNKSEMAVGYCTLYGDMSGGLAVISDVPKQLVYQLADYVNRNGEKIPKNIITKAPTAELKPDQTDQDDLPPYEVLDQILDLHLEKGKGKADLIGLGFEEHMVTDTLRRVKLNEYKRKQAPMGLKVTSKAFGFGRRYPNVQNYIE